MPEFSERSQRELESCDPRLIKIFNHVIRYVDCTILEGFRDRERQEELFRQGKTQVHWPDSKHNQPFPSRAIDVVPYPINWDDWHRMYMFVGYVLGVAKMMDIKLRVGADWDGDFNLKDQRFFDLPHFELMNDE